MIEETERLVERWQAAAAEGRSVDLYPEMVGITSRVIGRILFGADEPRPPELTRFSLVNDELLRRAVSPHPMPRWLPTSHNRQLSHELVQVRRIVDQIIAERQSEHLRPTVDMLDLLLAARDAENASDRLTDTEVANQVLLFLIAGRETTSVTLACTLLQLRRPRSGRRHCGRRSSNSCTDACRWLRMSPNWSGPTAFCANQ